MVEGLQPVGVEVVDEVPLEAEVGLLQADAVVEVAGDSQEVAAEVLAQEGEVEAPQEEEVSEVDEVESDLLSDTGIRR